MILNSEQTGMSLPKGRSEVQVGSGESEHITKLHFLRKSIILMCVKQGTVDTYIIIVSETRDKFVIIKEDRALIINVYWNN